MNFKLSSHLRTVFLGMMFIIPFFFAPSAHADVLLPGDISSCGELAAPGVYTLTGDIGTSTSPCLFISSDSVIVEGAGHTITGDVTSASGTDAVIDSGTLITPATPGISITLHNVTVTGSVNSGAGGSDSSYQRVGAEAIPFLTDNNPTATGVPIFSDDPYTVAWKAFNGDWSQGGWNPTWNTNSGYIGYQFNNPTVITQYAVTANNSGCSCDIDRTPRDWTFEGSNDGVNYTVLDTQANLPQWDYLGQRKVFSISNTTAYAYYRLNGVNHYSHENSIVIGQLEMMLPGSGSPTSIGGDITFTGSNANLSQTSFNLGGGAVHSGNLTITNTGNLFVSGSTSVVNASDLTLNGTDYGVWNGNLFIPGISISQASDCSLLTIPGTYLLTQSITGDCNIGAGITLDGQNLYTIDFKDSSNNRGIFLGDATFDDSSINNGIISGGATFNSSSYNLGYVGSYNFNFSPSDPNTVLNLNFDDDNGSTNFVDTSYNSGNHTISAVGNAQISTTKSKFGGSSLYLDGNGSYLTSTNPSDYFPGSSDFTVDTWVYLNEMPTSDSFPGSWSNTFVVAGDGTPSVADGTDFIIGQTQLMIQSNDGVVVSGTHHMTTHTWYHLTYIRTGNTLSLYVNGILVGHSTYSGSMGTGSGFYIGSETGEGAYFNGYIDDFKFTKEAPSIVPGNNATFNGLSFNQGTVLGNAIFSASNFDSNNVDGASPQIGTVLGTTTFSSLTPVTFTLRNSDTWNVDTSNWVFDTPGMNWVFDDHSSNGTIQQGSTSWNTNAGSYSNSNGITTATFSGSWPNWDIYQSFGGLTPGKQYTVSMYVKLGTATNFVLDINNQAAWNTIGGQAFSSSDLSTSEFRKISYTWTQPVGYSGANLHLGANYESALSGTPQTAGTVYLYGIQITNADNILPGNAVFNDHSVNVAPINGSAIFNDNSYNLGSVSDTATFNGFSFNQGSVGGSAIFSASNFDSNNIPGANPNQGIISGTTTFSSLTPVTFTLRNSDTWNVGTSNWVFATSGQNWSFYNSSQNDSVLTGLCKLYDVALNNGTCASIQYNKPFYFNATSTDTSWENINNWYYDASSTSQAPFLPSTGDSVYLDSTSSAPLTQTILSNIYVASSTGGAFSVDLTNLTGTSTVTSVWGGGIIKGIINGILNVFSNVALSLVDQASSPNGLNVNFYNSSFNDTNLFGNATFNDNSSNGRAPIVNVRALVVAGGGSGGGADAFDIGGGGGGGGGVLEDTAHPVTTGSYNVTVGLGGSGVAGFNPGHNGGNSTFDTLTAIGGGYGGTWQIAPTTGGSGGGAGENGQGLVGASGTSGQGYKGGNDSGYIAGDTNAGGGGGGAGGNGVDEVSGSVGGNGGVGYASDISGSTVYYGGGGGGAGSDTPGLGGNGGGGDGVSSGDGNSGTANTGGGGGGASTIDYNTITTGGNGGSGVVIISFPTGSLTYTTTGNPTETTSGGNTIITWTTNGTFVVNSIVGSGSVGNVSGTSIFNNSSSNSQFGTVGGLATFNNSTSNQGILNNATFNDGSYNIGLISATGTFNGTSYNNGTSSTGIFNNTASNIGTILNNAFFGGNSRNFSLASIAGEAIPPLNSNDPTATGVPFASSKYPCGGGCNEIWMAFDGNIGTGWYSYPTSLPNIAYVGYHFNTPSIISSYAVTGINSWCGCDSDRTPRDWTFEGSNDGVNYTVLDTQANLSPFSVNNERRVFAINNTSAYAYYRLNAVNKYSHEGLIGIHELEMFTPGSLGGTGTVLGNATFIGDLAENIGGGVSGIVQGLKTRLYNAFNPQTNFYRDFVADGPWKIIADNTFVNLLNNVVDYDASSTTATQFQNLNSGFILKKLSPGAISSCGIIDTPGTYTLTADVTGYGYSPCFLATTDGVIIDGGKHKVTALATSSSPYAVIATSTGDGASGHSITIQNITFTNFAQGVNANGNDNADGSGGNGGAVTILNSFMGDINSNGGQGNGGVGGSGGTIYIDPSVTVAVNANGGDGDIGGNGGAVTVLNSRGYRISANGGNALSCGDGGDSGSVTATNSLYPTVVANPGNAANDGCPSTPHNNGGSHQIVVTGTYTDPDAPQTSSATDVAPANTNTTHPSQASNILQTVSLPVNQVGTLTLSPLPSFGSGTKGSFSFLTPIQSFLFSPQGGIIDSIKKTAPTLNTFLANIGVATEQAIASLNVQPYKLTDTNVQGLFTVKGVGTRLTGDATTNLYQKVTTKPGTTLTISLIPNDNKPITATFNGQVYTFNKNNTLTLIAPSKLGTYFLKTPSSPIPLAIVVSSSKPTLSPVPQTNIQPPSFISKVLGWFGL